LDDLFSSGVEATWFCGNAMFSIKGKLLSAMSISGEMERAVKRSPVYIFVIARLLSSSDPQYQGNRSPSWLEEQV
jgi:hypothetical protein